VDQSFVNKDIEKSIISVLQVIKKKRKTVLELNFKDEF